MYINIATGLFLAPVTNFVIERYLLACDKVTEAENRRKCFWNECQHEIDFIMAVNGQGVEKKI